MRVGILEDWHLQRAINKVNQIFKNQIESNTWQTETDIDSEYNDWINQVIEARKSLTQILQLTDLKQINTDETDVLMFSVSLASDYEQCELRLEIYWEDGTAQLVAENLKYLALNEHIFEFIQEDEECLCELSPDLVSKIAKVLNLAKPYQEWEKSITSRKSLQNQVKNGQIKKTMIYFNAQQREIINYFSKAAKKASISLFEILEDLLMPVDNNAIAVRGVNSNSSNRFSFLNPLVSKIELIDEQWCLSLIWLNPPENPPIVEVNGNTEISYSWESDFSMVKIFGLKLVDFVDEVGVVWDDDSGKLRILLRY